MTSRSLCRETEVVRGNDSNLFYTPGIYYRPQHLKAMRVYIGSAQNQKIFENFELLNLNSSQRDPSHVAYTKYLETNAFLPYNSEQEFFSHLKGNTVPSTTAVLPATEHRGLFNVFPLSLTSDLLDKQTVGSSIGVVSTSPLRLELEFSQNLSENWSVVYTFSHRNRITYSGSLSKQDCVVQQIN